MTIARRADAPVLLVNTRDGGRIAYRSRGFVRGTGQVPALLVRPLGGSMSLWGEFESGLLERMPVVAFDHRGSGHSGAAGAWVTTASLARDALLVLDHLGITRAHVFGISLGGMVATRLAILAPMRVARLCLAAAPASGVSLTRVGFTRALSLAACLAKRSEDVEAGLVARILSERFRREHPDDVLRFEAIARHDPTSRMGLIKLAIAAATHDARSQIGRIAAETLVLVGEHDDVLGLQPSRDLAARLRSSRFAIVAESGHDLTLERPIVTATRVGNFFVDGT